MIIAGIILIVVLAYMWINYNLLVRLKNGLEGAYAQVDVQLKRRYDLIPNLVETVKGYASHEKEVFESVTKARSRAMGAGSVEERLDAENQLSGALSRLFAVAEAYPELKANENFMDLQNQLVDTENRISTTRRTYNDTVMNYHKAIQQFPRNILAGMFNFGKQPYFSATEEEKNVVRVQF